METPDFLTHERAGWATGYKEQVSYQTSTEPTSIHVARGFDVVVPGRLRWGADLFRRPANEIFTATPAAPRLVTPLKQTYADRIRDGVEKGYGVFRDGKEKKGPNFAGDMIVVQWGCGSPCMRMALVDARTGDVYYPPISFDGTAASIFDLPLLIVGESVAQNPKVQFRLNSSLMIIQATPSPSEHPPCCAYYFVWRQNRWILLRRDQLR